MRADWDARAAENPLHYVDDSRAEWTDEEFFKSGEAAVAAEILTDMQNICQGRWPGDMRILEIGCGAGRMTRALAALFGEVHAVDVSPAMIELARAKLAGIENVRLYVNSGSDLAVLPRLAFDFAFSFIVFQHVPSLDVIDRYVGEVGRLLRPGALFKFQVQGAAVSRRPDDTWIGVPVPAAEARAMAARHGFECRYMAGEGTDFFRLWFFKR